MRYNDGMAIAIPDDRFRAIAETASDIIFVVELDGTISYVNPYAARWLGKSADQIIGHRQDELFEPETAARQRASAQQVISQGIPLVTEDLTEFSGQRRYLNTRLTPLRDAQGAVRAIIGVARDTTEERLATDDLRRSEERFRALVEYSDEIIVINDTDGKRLYVSSSVEHILGYSPQEYLGSTIFDIAYPEDVQSLHDAIAKAGAQTRVPYSITFRARAKDASLRWLHAIITNFSDLPAVGGLVINMHDITELRQAQESQVRTTELERLAKIMTGRELQMIELKKQIERLKTEKGA